MGILDSLFGDGGGSRFSVGGTNNDTGGKHHGVRQNESGQKAGYVTYEKPTGNPGERTYGNREYAGPDGKR